VVSEAPNDFTVHIGIGRWVQYFVVAAVEATLLAPIFLAIDVPEMLWTTRVENGIAKQITQIVG